MQGIMIYYINLLLGICIGCEYAYTSCRTSQFHIAFIPLLVSLWYDLAETVFDGVGLMGFKSRANGFLFA